MNEAINNQQTYPVIENMRSQFETLFEKYHQRHARVFPVRFDLRYPDDRIDGQNNTDISRCMAKVVQRFKRQNADPVYAWVREQDKSHNPHYHCLLLLNGQVKREICEVFDVASQFWNSTIGSESGGLLDRCNKRGPNGVMINRSDDEHATQVGNVERQMDYMTKPRNKADSNDGLRDFGMTRLNTTNPQEQE